MFSVNDWARGPIWGKDEPEIVVKGKRERENKSESAREKEARAREGWRERTRYRFEQRAARVLWPLSGPKPELEFSRIPSRTRFLDRYLLVFPFFPAAFLPLALCGTDRIFAIATHCIVFLFSFVFMRYYSVKNN